MRRLTIQEVIEHCERTVRIMAEWNKRIAHSCYGCSMYYSDDKSWYNTKHCGGNHYECDYFCNGGKPNVGVYAVSEVRNDI